MNMGTANCLAALFFSLLGYSLTSHAVDFNLDVMDVSDRTKVDLTRFSTANYIMPGHYLMSLLANDRTFPERGIDFYSSVNDPKSTQACLPPELINQLGLKIDILKKLKFWREHECVALQAVKGVTIRPNLESGTLYLSIPQAYLEYRDPNWSPISEWDNGIAGLIVDYNVNASDSKYSGSERSQQISSNGTVGFNVGAWRMRGNFQGLVHRDKLNTNRNFNWNSLYAFRPLPAQGAKLLIGETALNSSLFDSFQFQGLNLSTDDQMLPPGLRGYAPEVSGVAKSNARVTVRQGGRVLYETTVPPGPFRISDINSAVSGKLDVEIVEDDGHVQNYQMETANVPYLSRPGYLRYNLTLGRPIGYERENEGPIFSSGEFSWGASNDWSVFGGGLLTSGYTALASGVGRNLQSFGVISADITQTNASIPHNSAKSGKSLRVNYAKRFDNINSEITFAGYRFSEKGFMTMNEFIDTQHGYPSRRNSKAIYTILANKMFVNSGLSAHISYTHEDYWNHQPTERLSAYLSRYFSIGNLRGLSTTLSLSQTQSYSGNDNSISLSLSMPFNNSQRIGYDTFIGKHGSSNTASYSKYENDRSYMISGNTKTRGQSVQGYYSQHTSAFDYNLNGSYQNDGSQSIGVSLQGGMTATRFGSALHRPAFDGGTRVMIDTDGIADVPLQNEQSLTNSQGIAVIPAVNNYYRTDVSIDVNKLPDNLEARRSVTDLTLTEGAIGYRKLSVIKGIKIMATLKLFDGSTPPFGASVQDSAGREVAIVADEGFVYLTGINRNIDFYVNWNGKQQCQILLPKNLSFDHRYDLQCLILH